jgi:TIR domain
MSLVGRLRGVTRVLRGPAAIATVSLDVVLFSRLTEDESRTAWVKSPPNPAIILLASAPAIVALLLRWRLPVIVALALAAHAALLTLVLGTRPLLTLVVALYTVSALRPLWQSLVCLAATLAAHGVAVIYEVYSFLDAPGRLVGGILIAAFFVLCDAAAWGVGRWNALAKLRERHLEELRDAMATVAVRQRESSGAPEALKAQRVFVNYRSEDTAHAAGRLGDELIRRFGEDRVFIDIDSLEPGIDFRKDIATAVAQTGIMLVLIGNRWLRSADGRKRLNDPDDVLRIEIEQALLMHVRVMPLLIDGARMPSEADLPPALQPLTRRNAMTLSARTFRRDVDDVVQRISEIIDKRVIG